MTRHRFSLEKSETGLRILTVWYTGTGWQEAIDQGLQAYGLTGEDRRGVQIIALPERESAQMPG